MILDAQLFLQPQPRVTEKIACLTDEVQYWRQILNIHRLSSKLSTVLFGILTQIRIYWQILLERTKYYIWQTVLPVTFALIQYMRTDKQDMTKLIVVFFSSFPETPKVIFGKNVRKISLNTYLVSAYSSQTSPTALSEGSAVLTAEDSFLFCSIRRVFLQYYSGNNF
jgi:hypothetical protein